MQLRNIILLTTVIVSFWYIYHWYIHQTTIEPMRGISEGTLTYHKRMFIKYIHRPIKHTIYRAHNNVKKQYNNIKRKYI